jgi:hypothetical protein
VQLGVDGLALCAILCTSDKQTETKTMTTKTKAALQKELNTQLTMLDSIKARIAYNKLNAKGRVSVSFPVWLEAKQAAIIDSWMAC